MKKKDIIVHAAMSKHYNLSDIGKDQARGVPIKSEKLKPNVVFSGAYKLQEMMRGFQNKDYGKVNSDINSVRESEMSCKDEHPDEQDSFRLPATRDKVSTKERKSKSS